MNRSHRLQVLVKLERLREQQRLREMHTAGQELEKQDKLTAQLAGYIDDYSTINSPDSSQPVDTRYLSNASRFVQNLQQALATQRRYYQQASEAFELKSLDWRQSHSRHQSVAGLVDNYRQQELRAEQAREEQESEDQWATLHARN